MLSDAQIVEIISVCTNGLSVVGSFFMVICYFYFKDIQSFAFKLVFYLNISDMVLGIGYLINAKTITHLSVDSKDNDALCLVQAGLINFGGLSALLWTAVIAFTLYQSVINGKNQEYFSEALLIVVAYGIPFIMTSYLYITKDYGQQDENVLTCWIRDDAKDATRSLTLQTINFYAPLIIIVIFNLVVYIRVMIYLRRLVDEDTDKAFINKLILYPLILIICWIWGAVNGMINYAQQPTFWLVCLQSFFGGLQGFFNSLVYGFTDQVKANLLKCWCKQKILTDEKSQSNAMELPNQTEYAARETFDENGSPAGNRESGRSNSFQDNLFGVSPKGESFPSKFNVN